MRAEAEQAGARVCGGKGPSGLSCWAADLWALLVSRRKRRGAERSPVCGDTDARACTAGSERVWAVWDAGLQWKQVRVAWARAEGREVEAGWAEES